MVTLSISLLWHLKLNSNVQWKSSLDSIEYKSCLIDEKAIPDGNILFTNALN